VPAFDPVTLDFMRGMLTENWDFKEVRAMSVEGNLACFQNELGDMYNEAFPLTEDKWWQKDQEKP
jgi:hypothetical protein